VPPDLTPGPSPQERGDSARKIKVKFESIFIEDLIVPSPVERGVIF